MLEQKALAYANMYGVLGALENLCVLDNKAKEIVNGINKPVSLCFDVKEGPCRTFHFDKSGCKILGAILNDIYGKRTKYYKKYYKKYEYSASGKKIRPR